MRVLMDGSVHIGVDAILRETWVYANRPYYCSVLGALSRYLSPAFHFYRQLRSQFLLRYIVCSSIRVQWVQKK